jgi:L-lactate dehydrogenase complex protein LldG
MVMSNSREEILHTIRKGLKGTSSDEDFTKRNISNEAQEIQHLTTEQQSTLKYQFISELSNVNTKILEARDETEINKVILNLTKEKKLESFSIWESKYLKKLKLKKSLKDAGLELITAKNKNRIANSNIGITEVDYAIVDTGTLVLLANNNQPRSVSLLPPIHLAIVRPESLVRDIQDLFVILKSEQEEEEDITSCMTFITGPSRTADIELNLTLGVHGPKELYVII